MIVCIVVTDLGQLTRAGFMILTFVMIARLWLQLAEMIDAARRLLIGPLRLTWIAILGAVVILLSRCSSMIRLLSVLSIGLKRAVNLLWQWVRPVAFLSMMCRLLCLIVTLNSAVRIMETVVCRLSGKVLLRLSMVLVNWLYGLFRTDLSSWVCRLVMARLLSVTGRLTMCRLMCLALVTSIRSKWALSSCMSLIRCMSDRIRSGHRISVIRWASRVSRCMS